MNESDFWSHLEYRVTREMAGSEECRRLGLWCDGMWGRWYWPQKNPPRVDASAVICSRNVQETWDATLFLTAQYEHTEEINWANQLPLAGATGWLAIDAECKRLHMRPSNGKERVDSSTAQS